MEKWKRIVIQGVICVGLLCVIWGGYILLKTYHADRILEIKEDDFSWVYQVDSVKTEGKDFVLQGFAFELDKDATEGSFEIILQDIESGKRYFPEMEYMKRTDVNEYFLCEYDYVESGFKAKISAKKLNIEKKNYEVLLRVEGERQTYQTETYISRGELMYVNPMEFEALDVTGTDLEEIVEQGVLRAYRPDYGMYVYQYEGGLYWIAEPTYDFVDGDSYIHFQLNTTQIDNLPKERIENQWFWDNIGFDFCENEILSENMGKYRVTKKSLPTEYSITKIWTGEADDWWVWRQDFRPFYLFE